MRRTPALVVALLLVVAACSGGDADEDAGDGPGGDGTTAGTAAEAGPAAGTPSAGCEGEAPAAGRTEESVQSGGVDRTYLRYVPEGLPDGPAPLVVDLTAYAPADLEERISGFTLPGADGTVPADEAGAVVVTPAPVGGDGDLRTWNLTDQPGWADDDLFLADLLARVTADTCVVGDRMLVMGFAIGGVMASRLACTMADDVALLVAVSGLDDPPGCTPSRPVPVLAFHGTGDRFLPYGGGVGAGAGNLPLSSGTAAGLADVVARRGPVTDAAAAWADRNGCAAEPTTGPVPDAGDAASSRLWAGCAADASVELVTIEGGEHTWPGSTTMDDLVGLLGPVTDAVSANDVILARYATTTAS
jgi:polyhydroxybutyrate depolymerase